MSARRVVGAVGIVMLAALVGGCAGLFGPRVVQGLVRVGPEGSRAPEWVSRPPASTGQTHYYVGIADQSRQESLARNLAFADALGQIAVDLAADVTEAIRVIAEEQPDLAGGIDLKALQSEVTDVFAATRISGARQEQVFIEQYAYYERGQPQYHVYKAYMLVALDRRDYERALQAGVEQLKREAQRENKAELERLYDEVMQRRAREGL